MTKAEETLPAVPPILDLGPVAGVSDPALLFQLMDQSKVAGNVGGLTLLAPLFGHLLDDQMRAEGKTDPKLAQAYADCVMPNVVLTGRLRVTDALRLLALLPLIPGRSELVLHLLAADLDGDWVDHANGGASAAQHVQIVRAILHIQTTAFGAALESLSQIRPDQQGDLWRVDLDLLRALDCAVTGDIQEGVQALNRRRASWDKAPAIADSPDWLGVAACTILGIRQKS
ncbi:MAG: hypothetical protein AAFQ66_11100 [Pseudomonadota bacterium]